MDRRNFAFDHVNFLLLAVCMAIVVIGFLLMAVPGSTETVYNPDIFSARRIKVAPVVCLVGFVGMVYAVLRKPKDAVSDEIAEVKVKKEAAGE